MVLLASGAYGAHKRNLHLRATPALSLHPEKARNKRNEFQRANAPRRLGKRADATRSDACSAREDIAQFVLPKVLRV